MSYRSHEEWVQSLRAQTKKGGVPLPGAIGGGVAQDRSRKTYAGEDHIVGATHEDIQRIIDRTNSQRCPLACADLNWGFQGRGINVEDYEKWMTDYAVAARQFHVVGDMAERNRILQDADCLRKYFEECLAEKRDIMANRLKEQRRERMDEDLAAERHLRERGGELRPGEYPFTETRKRKM